MIKLRELLAALFEDGDTAGWGEGDPKAGWGKDAHSGWGNDTDAGWRGGQKQPNNEETEIPDE